MKNMPGNHHQENMKIGYLKVLRKTVSISMEQQQATT